MVLVFSVSLIQHSSSEVEKRMFVDEVGGWRPNWMRESGGEEGEGEVRVDVMYSSTKSTKFLPEGLVSSTVDAWA